jgi:hypothetical protein
VTRGSHQKKAMLIISDGQDNASRYNFGEVRRLLKESDVVGLRRRNYGRKRRGQYAIGMQGQAFLDELTSVTGGKSFYPQTDVEMDEIFERIALELRHQYSIGYTPKDFEPDGKWHKTKVKVKPPRGLPRLTVAVAKAIMPRRLRLSLKCFSFRKKMNRKIFAVLSLVFCAALTLAFNFSVAEAQTNPRRNRKDKPHRRPPTVTPNAVPTVTPTPEDEEVIKVDTELVNLNVRVVDRNNRPINNLRKKISKVLRRRRSAAD